MKKLTAIFLAAIMALGLALTSNASPVREQTPPSNESQLSSRAVYGIELGGYLANSDGVVIIDYGEGDGDEAITTLAPGETVYFKLKTRSNLPVTTESAVSGIAITQDWNIGSGLISDVKIVQKKFKDRNEVDYCYMLALTAKPGAVSAKVQDAAGTITLKKSSGTDSMASSGVNSFAFTLRVRFFFEIGYKTEKFDVITPKAKAFDPEGARETVYFTFEDCSFAGFEVDVAGQEPIVLAADSKENTAIKSRYPNAFLTFFNGNGATFNKWGTLRLSAPEGSALYTISGNSLVPSNATYNSFDGAFIIETKTIGSYVIADSVLGSAVNTNQSSSSSPSYSSGVIEPDGFNSTTEYPVYSPNKVNPGTGAAA